MSVCSDDSSANVEQNRSDSASRGSFSITRSQLISNASQQVGVALIIDRQAFIGGSLHNSSIGGGKVVERNCRRPVEVLAPSDSLVTLDKSSGTSCYASFEVLTFGSENRLRNP